MSLAKMKKAKESKDSFSGQNNGVHKIQNDSLASMRMDENESLVSDDYNKSYKKDYDINV